MATGVSDTPLSGSVGSVGLNRDVNIISKQTVLSVGSLDDRVKVLKQLNLLSDVGSMFLHGRLTTSCAWWI